MNILSSSDCPFDEKTLKPLAFPLLKNTVGHGLVKSEEAKGPPLSIWPVVMERALRKYEGANHLTSYEKACAKATSIFYLLREGPALIDRLDLFTKCGQELMKSISPSELNPNTKVFVPSFLATNTLCQEESSTESSA